MKLTKDDIEFMERNGTWTHVGLKRKILKNQEDAEKLHEFDGKFVVSGAEYREFGEDADIVERLKNFQKTIQGDPMLYQDFPKSLPKAIQKILDGEK